MAMTADEKKQYDELNAYIEANKGTKGALMPVMQKAQEIFGYLGEDIRALISEGLGVSMAEIYGVATFYSQFALKPKGEHVIGVCMGTACYVRGSQAVFDRICSELDIKNNETTEDGKFTLEAMRCIGCCGLAPAIMIGGEVYGRLAPDQVPEILAKY